MTLPSGSPGLTLTEEPYVDDLDQPRRRSRSLGHSDVGVRGRRLHRGPFDFDRSSGHCTAPRWRDGKCPLERRTQPNSQDRAVSPNRGHRQRRRPLHGLPRGHDLQRRTRRTVVCEQTTVNSSGAFGRLQAVGSAFAGDDNTTLYADRLPAGQTVLFLNASATAFVPNPGGSAGDLCLGGSISRYARPGELRTSDAQGRATLTLDLENTPSGTSNMAILAGQSFSFQAWHRDLAGGAAGSHFTSALTVAFQ